MPSVQFLFAFTFCHTDNWSPKYHSSISTNPFNDQLICSCSYFLPSSLQKSLSGQTPTLFTLSFPFIPNLCEIILCRSNDSIMINGQWWTWEQWHQDCKHGKMITFTGRGFCHLQYKETICLSKIHPGGSRKRYIDFLGASMKLLCCKMWKINQ